MSWAFLFFSAAVNSPEIGDGLVDLAALEVRAPAPQIRGRVRAVAVELLAVLDQFLKDRCDSQQREREHRIRANAGKDPPSTSTLVAGRKLGAGPSFGTGMTCSAAAGVVFGGEEDRGDAPTGEEEAGAASDQEAVEAKQDRQRERDLKKRAEDRKQREKG